MPSEKILVQKQQHVTDLKEKINSAVACVLVNFEGINVEDDTKLRKELREAGIEYTVIKNTMMRLALKDTPYEEISSVLDKTTAVALSNEDPVAAARILCQYSDKSKGKFGIKAGFVDGKALDSAGVVELSKLPNKEGLISMLLSVLQGNIRGLAVALNAIAEKQGEGAVAAEPVAE